jgi:hypothetical protein
MAFMDRVKAAPGYAELRSKEHIRPANPAEFLYQMIGVDLARSEPP